MHVDPQPLPPVAVQAADLDHDRDVPVVGRPDVSTTAAADLDVHRLGRSRATAPATVDATGRVVYTPTGLFTGRDQFTVQACSEGRAGQLRDGTRQRDRAARRPGRHRRRPGQRVRRHPRRGQRRRHRRRHPGPDPAGERHRRGHGVGPVHAERRVRRHRQLHLHDLLDRRRRRVRDRDRARLRAAPGDRRRAGHRSRGTRHPGPARQRHRRARTRSPPSSPARPTGRRASSAPYSPTRPSPRSPGTTS